MKWDEYVDIFDTDVVSKIIILRNLPINEGWIDINELAEELQLNKKSVKKYVELLKDDITYYAVDNDASLPSIFQVLLLITNPNGAKISVNPLSKRRIVASLV